jgi:two-component system, OmpR family, sensor kinase
MAKPGTTEMVLRRLRWRLTVTLGMVAGVAITGLIIVLILVSAAADRRQLDTTLRGQASRAAALVFKDDNGRLDLSGVRDDIVRKESDALVVFSLDQKGRLVPVLPSSAVSSSSLTELARRALSDEEERGNFDWTSLGDGRARAAAMPWFDGQKVKGAAIVVQRTASVERDPVFVPAVVGGGLVLVLLLLTGWMLVGRSLRPAAAALADRERFLSTAAHELRAPLARLRAGAEAARRTSLPGDPSRQALRRLLTVADSAGQVVANLLLASRIDHAQSPIRYERFRLDQLAADLEHSVEDLIVDIREPVAVRGDPGLLRHAVANLVDNSLRHGRVGDDAPTVVVRVFRRESSAVIQVCDDGPGFPPDIDVLARYVTGPRGGTGLGLPLVLWIAERHGATFSFENGTAERPGAVVEIVLPVDDSLDERSNLTLGRGHGRRALAQGRRSS